MMRRSSLALALAGALSLPAAAATAQMTPPPGHSAMAGMPAMMAAHNAAQALLAHSAELKLSDQQVVKLNQIAQRVEAMHKAHMDSVHAKMGAPGGGGAMPKMSPAQMQQMHDQMRADVRDALSVLTPDQLADAWMLVVMHAHGGMAAHGAMMKHPGGMGGMGTGGAGMAHPKGPPPAGHE